MVYEGIPPLYSSPPALRLIRTDLTDLLNRSVDVFSRLILLVVLTGTLSTSVPDFSAAVQRLLNPLPTS